MRLRLLLPLCLLGALHAGEAAPPPHLLTIGNYMTSLGPVSVPGMAAVMLDAAGAHPGLTVLGFSANAHASEAENWEAGFASWFTGDGATDSPHANVRQQREAIKGRKPALAMLQVDPRWTGKGKDDAKLAANREAVGRFAASATAAQVPLVLFVLPGMQNTTGRKGKAPGESTPHAPEQYATDLAARHEATLALARELRTSVTVAPTYLAFAELRRIKPDLSLHAPRPADDGHLSPRDAALCAATVAAAAQAARPAKTATAEQVFAAHNAQVSRENEKQQKAGKPGDAPLAVFTAEEWQAVQDAAWAAVAHFRTDLAAAPKGTP